MKIKSLKVIMAIGTILCFALLQVSCTTYGVKKPISAPTGTFQRIQTPKYQVKSDFLKPEQVREYFGVDLYQIGVQTINVEIQNTENRPMSAAIEDIYLKDRASYIVRPLDINALTDKIYNFTKYKEMTNRGLKKGALYGLGGTALGALAGAIAGGVAGGTTAGEGAATGAVIGAGAGATAGAAKGAMEAKQVAYERIQKDLSTVMFTPGRMEGDVVKRGMLFFEIQPQDMGRLEVKLRDLQTQERMDLNLEFMGKPGY